MHRVIVPIDFSDTSYNAARFTAQMLAGKADALAILYNNYEHKKEKAQSIAQLESLKTEMHGKGVAKVDIETEMGGDLIENIANGVETRKPVTQRRCIGRAEFRLEIDKLSQFTA